MKEKDLEIYDVWKATNGNIFIKTSEEYSIAIGPIGDHGPNEYDLKQTQYVKTSEITGVKKIGKVVILNND